jgi:hypothetical protein
MQRKKASTNKNTHKKNESLIKAKTLYFVVDHREVWKKEVIDLFI